MQKWRRGKGKYMPYTPKEFGLMIDDCIRILRKMSDEQYNYLINEKRSNETDD